DPKTVVVALKITILREGKHSVSGYKITSETDMGSVKDTGRMLEAGADKVLWLRCDEFNVEKGIDALLFEIPENAMVICESNSARNYIEPGLFIMVRKSDEGEIKKTAIGVMDFPHIEIRTSMNGDDVVYIPDITDKILVVNGRFKFDM
ncbi:MAG TPA: hypothetical protein VLJ60_12130, partial [bacterium]|nr:hypothetical protein [bacterium]